MSDKEIFETGSQRDSREGKGRLDLLPPMAILRVAKVYEQGAEKYGVRNWELGQPQDRFMDSALRHLFQWQAGKRDEDHLAHAAFNILAMIHFDEKGASEPKPKCYRVVSSSERNRTEDPYGVRAILDRGRDPVSVPERDEDQDGIRDRPEEVQVRGGIGPLHLCGCGSGYYAPYCPSCRGGDGHDEVAPGTFWSTSIGDGSFGD